MKTANPHSPNDRSHQSETYTHADSTVATDLFSRRTAASHAAFFLPNLRSGMSLLDCGCGVGSITVSLAEIAAPGEDNLVDNLKALSIKALTVNAPYSDNTTGTALRWIGS